MVSFNGVRGGDTNTVGIPIDTRVTGNGLIHEGAIKASGLATATAIMAPGAATCFENVRVEVGANLTEMTKVLVPEWSRGNETVKYLAKLAIAALVLVLTKSEVAYAARGVLDFSAQQVTRIAAGITVGRVCAAGMGAMGAACACKVGADLWARRAEDRCPVPPRSDTYRRLLPEQIVY